MIDVNNLLDLSDLPYVSLVKGNLPKEDLSSLVAKITGKYDILESDVVRINDLTIESSKAIKDFSATEPLGNLKLIVVNLDTSSTRSQNSLLSVLENPPSRVRFLLFSSSPVLTTVESRSEIFYGLFAREANKQTKAIVLAGVKATFLLDEVRLEEVLRNWDDSCHKLLLQWAVEHKLLKSEVFSEEELLSTYFPKGFEDNLILALSILDSARPRISVKSVLFSYIEKSKGSN